MNEVLEEKAKARRKQKDVRFWEERIRFAKRVAEPYHDEYSKNLDYYVGKQQPVFESSGSSRSMVPSPGSENMLVVNRILPSLASQNAQILWRIPWWRASSRRLMTSPIDEAYRENAEYLTNFALRTPKNDVLLQMRLGLLATECAYGAWKVTWTPDEGIDPEEGKPETLGELVIEMDPETGQEVPNIRGGVPRIDPKTGKPMRRGRNKFVLDTRDLGDYLRTDWIDWRDLVHDPEGGNSFFDHRWISHRYCWDYDEFMSNDFFTNKEEIENTAHWIEEDYSGNWKDLRLYRADSTFRRRSQPGYLERDKMRIWGYQIMDLVTRECLYIVDGHDKMVGKSLIPGWCGFSPYVFSKFNEVPGEWWHYPDVTPARPLAADYNITRSQVLNHRRRFNRKYGYLKGKIDQIELEKLKNPDDGTCVEWKQMDAIKPIIDAPLDDAVYRDMDRAILDMSEVMAVSPEARQVADSDTATQAAIIERHGSSRIADKRALIAKAMKQVGNLALSALQANLDEPIAVRILGPQGQHWQSVVGQADIAGDYELDVDISELEPQDQKSDRADLLALAQIFGPETVMLSPTLLKRLLQSFRQNDPKVVQELHQIGVLMQMQKLMGGGQGGPGEPRGGAKPPGRGPEGDSGQEGRREGRNLRAIRGGGAA